MLCLCARRRRERVVLRREGKENFKFTIKPIANHAAPTPSVFPPAVTTRKPLYHSLLLKIGHSISIRQFLYILSLLQFVGVFHALYAFFSTSFFIILQLHKSPPHNQNSCLSKTNTLIPSYLLNRLNSNFKP